MSRYVDINTISFWLLAIAYSITTLAFLFPRLKQYRAIALSSFRFMLGVIGLLFLLSLCIGA